MVARCLWACVLALSASGCDGLIGGHVIDLNRPSKEDLGKAFLRLKDINPPMEKGRWEVATSVPGITLEGVDAEIAEKIRAAGKALNTTTRCREESQAIDIRTQIMIGVEIRDGCAIDRFTADPGMLAYRSTCTVGESTIVNETKIGFKPSRFVSTRKTLVGYNGNAPTHGRVLQYDGAHVGQCMGNEDVQSTFWSDRP